MKSFILVDKSGVIRCMASDESNLHTDKLHMDKYHVEIKGTVGDEYDSLNDTWIARPENYPQPSEQEKRKVLIEKRKNKIVEDQAIQELIAEGLLPPDYEPGDNDA